MQKKSTDKSNAAPATSQKLSPNGRMRASLARDTSAVPDETFSLPIRIESTIRDSWRGAAETYEIWGDTPCVPYITQTLSEESVFKRVADFFGRREIARVLVDCVPVKIVKPTDAMIMKPKLFKRVMDCNDMTAAAAGVICDISIPVLRKVGLLTDDFKFSRHVRHGFAEVTVDDLKTDVTIYALLEVAGASIKNTIDASTRYNVEVLAEIIADGLRAVGNSMMDVDNLSGVIDDMLMCVRAHIDPMGIAGNMTGSVPTDWANNSNIADLAKNLVFVRAALALPVGSSISVTNLRRLDKWCAVVVSAIKSSARYRWIGRSEAARDVGLRKVRDVQGRVRSSVLFRAMQAEAVSQNVRVLSDDFMEGASLISATRDQVAATVQEAYGRARFSSSQAVDVFTGVLSAAVEQGWTAAKPVYNFSDSDLDDMDPVALAMLLSDKVYVEVNSGGEIVKSPVAPGATAPGAEPKWWFSVPTTELSLNVLSGRHYHSRVITSDYLEVFLAHDAFEPRDALLPKAQLLGPAAFNTRVIDFDTNNVQEVDERLRFEMVINGVSLVGALRGPELSILRSRTHTALVVPHFNQAVVRNFAGWLECTVSLIGTLRKDMADQDKWTGSPAVLPSDAWFDYLSRMPAHLVRNVAAEISDHFRLHIRESVIERAIVTMGITQDAADVMRARLQQRAFLAYADVIALQFFLYLQGMSQSVLDGIISSDAMAAVCIERG